MPLSDEEVKRWKGRIDLGKVYQEKYGNKDKRWEKYVKGLAGDFNSAAELGQEAIDVNITRSDIKTRLAPLWLQEPFFAFKPTREFVEIDGKRVDNVARAEYSESEINYWTRELRVREYVTKPCVLDGETTNHGYAYVGYISEKVEVETKKGDTTEPDPLIRFKQPFVMRISPRNVLLPPGKCRLEEHEWVCLLWLKHLDDVTDRYGKKAEGVKPMKAVMPAFGETTTGLSDALTDFLDSEDSKLVEIQQVWDKRSKMIYTFAEGHETVLSEEKWDLEMEGFPLVDLSFEDVPDEYYATPPQQYAYPQQKELNAIRTTNRRRFNRMKSTIITSGDVDDSVVDAYAKAEDGKMIRSGLSVDEDVRKHFFVDQGLPPDAGSQLYEGRIWSDYLQIQGTSTADRGSGDPNVDSATESANISQKGQIRSTDRGDRVRSFYLDIARKLWMVLQQQPDVKRDRMVAGNLAGQFKQLNYSLKELRGEFAISIDISTVMPDSPTMRLTLAQTNYNLFRADPLVDPEQLILDIYTAQNTPNPSKYLLALRQPDEELQMMLQGLPVEPHERDNHEMHMERHQMHAARIDKALDEVDPEDESGQKVRIALLLMVAHLNSHARIMQKIVSAQGGGRQPGSPVAENMLRNQMRERSGSETGAELRGQPLVEGR